MGRIIINDPLHVGGSDALGVGANPNDNTGDPPRTMAFKLIQWATDLNTMLTEIYTTGPELPGLGNFANDAAAATGGVAVGNLYRNGSIVMVRVS